MTTQEAIALHNAAPIEHDCWLLRDLCDISTQFGTNEHGNIEIINENDGWIVEMMPDTL